MLPSTPLKIGVKLICVRPTSPLKRRHVYTVTAQEKPASRLVAVFELPGLLFHRDRFKVVES